MLLEARQLLGREFSAAGREWVKSGKSEVMVQPGSIAKSLLAEQLELGTRVLLNAQAGGILTAADKAAMLLYCVR